MNKCKECGARTRVQKYEHVSDVAGTKVRDASGAAVPTCPECGAVELSLTQVQRYEQRAAATVMRSMTAPSGPVLRYARRALDLTQTELAAELGCASETVSRWETGAVPAPRAIHLAIIGLLDAAFYAPGDVKVSSDGELVVPIFAA
jgi:putative zinc finger/helix-turn-helix YgiT family protein